MTNMIAIVIGLFLLAAMTVDVVFYDTENMIFLGRKMFELIEWMAFWR